MKKTNFHIKSILFVIVLSLFFSCEKEELIEENPKSFLEIDSDSLSVGNQVLIQNSFLLVRDDLSLWFKAGSHVTFYNTGKVKEGVLAHNQWLLIAGVGQRGSLQTKEWFKAGTKIFFNAKGEVSKGTLYGNSWLPIGWGNSGNKLWFKGGTEISFNYGTVASGFLLNNSFITVTGYSNLATGQTAVWFRKGYKVQFDFYGNAMSGNLVNLNSSRIANNRSVLFTSWTEISFDGERGFVKSGTLYQRTYLY